MELSVIVAVSSTFTIIHTPGHPDTTMSLPRVSPRRRKSAGLSERNLNHFDNDNLTLPVTLKPKKRGVSIGGDLASSSSIDGLNEMQRKRRAAVSFVICVVN